MDCVTVIPKINTQWLQMFKGAVSPIFSFTMNSQKMYFVQTELLKQWSRFVNNNPTSVAHGNYSIYLLTIISCGRIGLRWIVT